MFSMNSLNFIDSWLVPGDSLENHEFMENIGQANVFHQFLLFPGFLADPRRFSGKLKFMENIGQANVFHDFLMEIHGKHWPGQCFS